MTTPTNKPVPSSDPRDLLFNAQKLDLALSSGALAYTDRLGVSRLTLAGATETLKAFNYRGVWAAATTYALKDVVNVGGVAYVCTVPHTSSGAFAADADRWSVHQGATQQQLQGYVAGEPGRPLREVACVIRPTAGVWAEIDDVDHQPIGLSGVSVVGDAVRVTYSFTGVKVTSMFGGVDEAMASRGVTFGPSVGTDYANFSLFMPMVCWIAKTAGVFGVGNMDPWLGPGTDTTLTTVDETRFILTHKTASGDVPPVASILTASANAAVECRLSYGGTSVTATFYQDFHGYVYYDTGSATWKVDTPNFTKPTFSYSAGVLTVTHESIPDSYFAEVLPVGGILWPYSGTPSSNPTTRSTSFTTGFVDGAGVPFTGAANGNMKFVYRRNAKVRSSAPDGTAVVIQRGPVLLNPASMDSATGNLWIRGVIEVAP